MSILPGDILQQMLDAAKTAAGTQWSTFSGDMRTFAQNVLDDTKMTTENLAQGKITEDEAKILFDGIVGEGKMIANYAQESLKLAAQNAINAASNVLWSAIKAAVP